ncbi:MAG TPA: Hsp20/alpha crystallin family protein [Verrucomicrobiae bacterium]|nr:Hsp20/alpha crystallin family protein [Verrucomicrobiae bacterium]
MKSVTEDRTTNGTTSRSNGFIGPAVDVYETEDGYVLTAEMPGVNKDGLEVTLEGTEITIIGRRNQLERTGESLIQERLNADYRRVFELDPAIDTARISARVDKGILTLTLPKSEKVKPRKIKVKE